MRSAERGRDCSRGASGLWSRSFPVLRHRLRTSSPRFRTCSRRLPLWASRSHNCRPILPPCSASPEWLLAESPRKPLRCRPVAVLDSRVLPSGAAQWSQILLASGHWGIPSTGNVAGHPTLGSVATGLESTTIDFWGGAGRAGGRRPDGCAVDSQTHHQRRPGTRGPDGAGRLALPGIGGLLIISAAGMLVGYRQAKAAFTLRAAGIARFARLGPLGVVRSGSLVALRPRASSVVRRQPSPGGDLPKTVA